MKETTTNGSLDVGNGGDLDGSVPQTKLQPLSVTRAIKSLRSWFSDRFPMEPPLE